MKTYRPSYHETLIRRLAHLRRPGGHGEESCYEILSLPHRHSPFLTLAEHEDPQRRQLPLWVLKILVVLEEDSVAHTGWSEILRQEQQRWREELAQRLERPNRVDRLQVPLATPVENVDEVVFLEHLGPLRRADLLSESTGGQDPRFQMLARPFIPWPCLRDVGYSMQQMQSRWRQFCEKQNLPDTVCDDRDFFHHFCNETLIPGGSQDPLLTSAWRFRRAS